MAQTWQSSTQTTDQAPTAPAQDLPDYGENSANAPSYTESDPGTPLLDTAGQYGPEGEMSTGENWGDWGGSLGGSEPTREGEMPPEVLPILGSDPRARENYEEYLNDPNWTVRSLLMGQLLFLWDAFERMDQVCRRAAEVEAAERIARGEHGPRVALLGLFPTRAATALVLFRTGQNVSDAELLPVLAAVQDDDRLATAQAFLTAAFASGAAGIAKRLYGLALAQAQEGGQTAEAAERAALGVYTRAMPAGQTEADIAASRESYALTVPLDVADGKLDVPVQTPYHISSRLGATPAPIVEYSEDDVKRGDEAAIARKKVAYGKGSADEIQAVLLELVEADAAGVRTGAVAATGGHADDEAARAAGAFVSQWMSDHDVGVDCSGFAFEATAQQDDAVGDGWKARRDDTLDGTAMNGANVAADMDPANSEEIPVSAARPGDLVINRGISHVGVVEQPAIQERVVGIADAEVRKRICKKLGLTEEQSENTLVWNVGIAHSADTGGQGGSDLPGPHLGTYWFADDGAQLAADDPVVSSFATFRRPLLAPPGK